MSPNVAVISAAIAVLTLVFAIFGASWLNQRNIERLFEQLEKRLEQLKKRFAQRVASVEQRLDRIERQLEAIFKPMLPPRA